MSESETHLNAVAENGPNVLSYAPPARGQSSWPIPTCIAFLITAFLLQATVLPCLCSAGTVKMSLAYAVDAAFIFRVILARVLHQKGRDWIVYVCILLSSVIWIEWVAESSIVWMVLNRLGLV